MTEEKKINPCKCGLATFGYADTTDRLKFFVASAYKDKSELGTSSRGFAAFVAQQLDDYLKDIEEHCSIDTKDARQKITSIRLILKEEEKPLDLNNYLVVEGLFNELDPLIVPELKKCARD